MNNDFLDALISIEKEKNISRVAVIEAVEQALMGACKNHFGKTDNVTVSIDPKTCETHVVLAKKVVRTVKDDAEEISLKEAHAINPAYKAGDIVNVEIETDSFGRIIASAAKNAIVQKIRDEERRIVYDEFKEKEHRVVTGVIQRFHNHNITINLGKTDAFLPVREQIHGERYRIMDRIKVYVIDVSETARGLRINVSRTHPELVRQLFEEEVTEVREGIVEIKAIAREAGSRTKIAVYSNDEDVDAVGACVGMNGSRVNAICAELGNERIDIINWNENPAMMIENALSPSKVISVIADSDDNTAKVVVPDYQLSLAIGREGQNARLAARLTGFKIDIKSETQAREAGDFMGYDEEFDEYYDEDGYYDENGNFEGEIDGEAE